MSNQQAIIDALVESHLQAVTSAQSSPPSQLFLRHLDIVDDHLISSPSTVNTAPSYTATSLLSPSPSSDMEMRQFPGTGKDTKMKPTSAFDWYDGEPIDCDALTKKIPSLRRPNLFATNRLNFKRRQHCDDLNDLDFSLVFEPSSAAGSCSSFTLNDGDVNEMSPPPSPSPTKLTREALRELFLSARIHKQLHHDDSSSPPVPQDDDLSLPSSLSYLPSPFLTSSSQLELLRSRKDVRLADLCLVHSQGRHFFRFSILDAKRRRRYAIDERRRAAKSRCCHSWTQDGSGRLDRTSCQQRSNAVPACS